MKANQKKSQVALVRELLAKKVPADLIAARVRKACGGKPTVGYVSAIAKKLK